MKTFLADPGSGSPTQAAGALPAGLGLASGCWRVEGCGKNGTGTSEYCMPSPEQVVQKLILTDIY